MSHMPAHRTVLVLVLQLVLIMLGTLVQPAQGDSNGYVSGAGVKVPYALVPPASDGICKVDEWKDSLVVGMVPYSFVNSEIFLRSAKAYLMLKHDDDYLYGCVDWTSQKILRTSESTFRVDFDTQHNGFIGHQHGPDDLDFAAVVTNIIANKLQFTKMSFIGTPVDEFTATGSLTPPNESNSTRNVQIEFAVPMEQLKMHPNPSDPNTVGFFVMANSDNPQNGVAYPLIWDQISLYQYGNYHLADMTFLPKEACYLNNSCSTTTSLTLSSTSATYKSSSVAGSTVSSSSQMAETTPSMLELLNLSPKFGWLLFLVPVAFVLIGAILVINRHNKRKTQ